MKIAFGWLKEYIHTDLSAKEIAAILTRTGLEVESIETYQSLPGGLEGCVIGKVISCERHPNADKLSVTRVDAGDGYLLSIVCGAPNVRAGQKVVVAKTGTTLFKKGQAYTLEQVRIRGELSEGMICAEDELGLGEEHDGIIVVESDTPIGLPAGEYFQVYTDTIFEVGLTPNRIDGASHFGAARDLAAYLGLYGSARLVKPTVSNFSVDNNKRIIPVIIENQDACKRYCGITISGVTVKESPVWLKNRLLSVGLSPINNIVDITNYVLYELGQPLHAFDADKITGQKVIVKTLPEGSKFISLDGQERTLSPEDLMICNTAEGMCLAGIFGGISTGVTNDSTNVFLESAWFNPVSIRKSSKRHGLTTDASFRFERGADPEMMPYALKRAAALIREIAGGKISSEIIDEYPEAFVRKKIQINFKNVDRLIGNKLDKKVICRILSLLDFTITAEEDDHLLVDAPLYRVDVTREADVIEEILRIYGYDNITTTHKISASLNNSEKPDKEKLTALVADFLSSNGFNEIMSNSLSKDSYYRDKQEAIRISNPISMDMNTLRTTLIYGGLEALSYNINRRRPNLRFYEFGSCYHIPGRQEDSTALPGFSEQEFFGIFLAGNKYEGNWIEKTVPGTFFQLKSFLDAILQRLSIHQDKIEIRQRDSIFLSEGLSYYNNNLKISEFGSISQEYLSSFDIKTEVYYGEINWTNLLICIGNPQVIFSDLPKFPEVKRDLSMIIDRSIRYEDIRKLAFQTEKEKLKNIALFDVFEGENIGKEKKSYAVSFILQDLNATLTDNQIDTIINRLASAFEKKLGAQIRK